MKKNKKIMPSFNPRTLTIYCIAMLAGGLLLHTSQNVQIQQDKRSSLKQSLAEENDRIRMLQAEWAYLNSPERLERLSAQYMPAPTEIAPTEALKANIKDIPLAAPDPVPSLIAIMPSAEPVSQEASR